MATSNQTRPVLRDHWLPTRPLLSNPTMLHLRLSTWLAILAVLVSGLDAKALYHRIYHPILAPAARFSLRGTLHDGAVVDASGLESDLASFDKFISQLDTAEKLNEALYQVAYERDSDLSPEDRILSSVKAVSMSFSSSTRHKLELIRFLGEPGSVICMLRLPTPSSFIFLAMANHLRSIISSRLFHSMASALARRGPRLG